MFFEDSAEELVDRLLLIALERIDIVVYILYRNVHEYGSYERKFLVVILFVPVLGISEFNALYKVDYIAHHEAVERRTDSEEKLVSAVRFEDRGNVFGNYDICYRILECVLVENFSYRAVRDLVGVVSDVVILEYVSENFFDYSLSIVAVFVFDKFYYLSDVYLEYVV